MKVTSRCVYCYETEKGKWLNSEQFICIFCEKNRLQETLNLILSGEIDLNVLKSLAEKVKSASNSN
jgi:hypothetical protein